MLDQNTFTETIRAVQDIIRTSAEPMTREEILSYFMLEFPTIDLKPI